MRYVESKSKNDMFIFESMGDIIEFTDSKRFKADSKSFVGEELRTWKEVEARAKRCWAEGMYTIQQFVDRLRDEVLPELKDHKRKIKFSEDNGDEVDIDRLRSGDPFYRTSEREESAGPLEVTIITDATTPANRDTKDILWRGAAALALTEVLEEKGFRVELWIVHGSQLYAGKRKGVHTAACLKRCSDPLDTSTLINTVAGWFYRTVLFAADRTICDRMGERVAIGLGECQSPNANDLDELSRDANRIYSSGVYSFNGALNMIVAEVKKIAKNTTR